MSSIDMLSMFQKGSSDDIIIKQEFHTYLPYTTNAFNANDEIKIPNQSIDLYLVIANSFIYLEGESLVKRLS